MSFVTTKKGEGGFRPTISEDDEKERWRTIHRDECQRIKNTPSSSRAFRTATGSQALNSCATSTNHSLQSLAPTLGGPNSFPRGYFPATRLDLVQPVSINDETIAKQKYKKANKTTPTHANMTAFRKSAKFLVSFLPLAFKQKQTIWSQTNAQGAQTNAQGDIYHKWSLGVGRVMVTQPAFAAYQSRLEESRKQSSSKNRRSNNTKTNGIYYNATPFHNVEDMKSIFGSAIKLDSSKPIQTITSLNVCLAPVCNYATNWQCLQGGEYLDRYENIKRKKVPNSLVSAHGRPAFLEILELPERGMVDFENQNNFGIVCYQTDVPTGKNGKTKKKTVHIVSGFPIAPIYTWDMLRATKFMLQQEVYLCFTNCAVGDVEPIHDYYTFWYTINVIYDIAHEMFKLLSMYHLSPSVSEYVDRAVTFFNYGMATTLFTLQDNPDLQKIYSDFASQFVQCPLNQTPQFAEGPQLKQWNLSMRVLTCLVIGVKPALLVDPILKFITGKMVFLINSQRSKPQQKKWKSIMKKWSLLFSSSSQVTAIDLSALSTQLTTEEKKEIFTGLKHLLYTILGDIMVAICYLKYFRGRSPQEMYNTLKSNFNQIDETELRSLREEMIIIRKRFDQPIKKSEHLGELIIFLRKQIGWEPLDSSSSESNLLNWQDFLKLFAHTLVNFNCLCVQKPLLTENKTLNFNLKGTLYLEKEREEKYKKERARIIKTGVNLSFADQMIKENCPICHEPFREKKIVLYIPCSHICCTTCTTDWQATCIEADKPFICVLCRGKITNTMFMPTL